MNKRKKISNSAYEAKLAELQVELVKLQEVGERVRAPRCHCL